MRISSTILALFIGCSLSIAQSRLYVDLDAQGANDGTTWENAYNDLQDALIQAADDTEIWIAEGTYLPTLSNGDNFSSFIITSKVSLIGGFNGTESDLNDRDLNNHETILSGDHNGDDVMSFDMNRSDNSYHVVTVEADVPGPVFFGDLTVSNGHTLPDNDPADNHRGAGILAYSPVEINACLFTENFGRAGACVAIIGENTSGSLVLNSEFRQNLGSSQSAGIFLSELNSGTVEGCLFESNTVTRGTIYPFRCNNILLKDNVISNNACTASDGFGAGIFLWQSVEITLENCTIENNECGNGTGIYVDGRELIRGVVSLNINNCTFSGNNAMDYGGAGIYVWRTDVQIDGSIFSKNTSANTGGAIYAGGSQKTITIENTEFSENTAFGGWGGAHTIYGDTSRLEATNCVYKDNMAATSGGAMSTGFGSSTSVNQSTFEGNMAQFGGAAYAQNDSSYFDFFDCEFTGNSCTNFGGALNLVTGATHIISGCRFELNISGDSGGSLSIADPDELDTDTTTVLVYGNEFIENIAEIQGGGIYISDANAVLTNNIMASNTIYNDFGGAISHNAGESGVAILSMINNTLYENVGAAISGIASYTEGTGIAQVEFHNNIIHHSLSLDIGVEDGSPTYLSKGGNLVLDPSQSATFSAEKDILDTDPLLSDPDNGDYCLRDNSPCVNTGIDEGAPALDGLGQPRLGITDKGFCENQNVVSTKNEKSEPQDLRVAPNPASDVSNITYHWSGNPGEAQLTISGLDGKVVWIQTVSIQKGEGRISIPLDQLSHGAYIIELHNEDMYARQRLIKH